MDVRRAVAALLLLGLLVSCSDDEPSSEPPEPTGSATVSPTLPVEPELPSAAKAASKPGAVAFLKYYWAMVAFAEASGDTDRLRQLAMESCQSCARGIAYVERVHNAGGVIRSDARKIHIQNTRRGASQGTVLVFIDAELVVPPSQDFYGAGDRRNKRWRGGHVDYQFVVQRAGVADAWRLAVWDVAR